LTTIAASSVRATSARRSVPLGWSARVSTASAPVAAIACAMRASSVATMTRASPRARRVRSATWQTIGRPPISASAFPGSRVE